MGLSRKRKKELKKLRSSATDVWVEQRDVIDRVTVVVREAARQLGFLSREEVTPRVRGVVDNQFVPVVASSVLATKAVVGGARQAVGGAKHKVLREVLPVATGAVATAVAAVRGSEDPRVQEVLRQLSKTGGVVGKSASTALAEANKAYNKYGIKYGFVTPPPPPKTGLGFGGYSLITVGVIAVGGIAYAAWQTLRADDELWVLDETDDTVLPD